MATMCQFVQIASQTIIFVNPDVVRVVMTNPSGGTDIIFDQGHYITVVEQAEIVVRRLDEAK